MWYSLTSMPYLSNPGFSNEFSSSNEAPLPIQYIGCPRKRKGLLGLKVFYRTPIKVFLNNKSKKWGKRLEICFFVRIFGGKLSEDEERLN